MVVSFKINNRYKYGMCFGRGRVIDEALNDLVKP